MEHRSLSDVDQRFANRLLIVVVAASLLCFVVLAVLAAAQPASAAPADGGPGPAARPVLDASAGTWRTGVDGVDLALIALTLVGVAILVRRHAPSRR